MYEIQNIIPHTNDTEINYADLPMVNAICNILLPKTKAIISFRHGSHHLNSPHLRLLQSTKVWEYGADANYECCCGGFCPSCHDGYRMAYVVFGDDMSKYAITLINMELHFTDNLGAV